MRTALLIPLIILLFSLSVAAQIPSHKLISTLEFKRGAFPVFSDMVVDEDGNTYLTQKDKVTIFKEGKVVHSFPINQQDYTNSYLNRPTGLAVNSLKEIYLINLVKRRLEKHSATGTLLNTIDLLKVDPKIHPANILVDSKDYIYIYNGSHKVYILDNYEKLIRTIELPKESNPNIIASGGIITLDSEDNLYFLNEVMDDNIKQRYTYLKVYDNNGKLLHDLTNSFNRSQSVRSGDMKVDSDGKIYISSDLIPRINVFNTKGEFVKGIYSLDQSDIWHFPFSFDLSLGFDKYDNLHIGATSGTSSGLQIVDSTYNIIQSYRPTKESYKVTIDAENNILMLDSYAKEIVKMDILGKTLSSFSCSTDYSYTSKLESLSTDKQGNIYVLESESTSATIRKYSKEGKLLQAFSNIKSDNLLPKNQFASAGLLVDDEGNMYVTSYNGNALTKYSPEGTLLYSLNKAGKTRGMFWKPLDVTADANGFIYVLDDNGNRVQKLTASGVFVDEFKNTQSAVTGTNTRASISADTYGNFAVAINNSKHNISWYDISGKPRFQLNNSAASLSFSNDGKYLVTSGTHSEHIYVYEDTVKHAYNFVKGTLYNDSNENCFFDIDEKGLENFIIKAEPGPYYAITNEYGNYTMQLGEGSYTVRPILSAVKKSIGRIEEETCPTPTQVDIEGSGHVLYNKNVAAKVTLSPFLSVGVSSTRRRRCFDSTTKLTYTNSGFAPALNAKVYFQLPKEVELLSADKPYTRLPNGTYVFEVGNVAPGQTSVITIKDKVTCGDESVRGLTVCTKAWITPSNKSVTTPTAVATITGKCNYETGMVRFVIKNSGEAGMDAGNQFRLYLDGQLSTIENYNLAAGDSLVLWVPTGGKTARLEADQPEGNGDNKLASTTIEACRVIANRVAFSSDFVNVLPTDDEEAEAAEECLVIRDSYDPNDKIVAPIGLTEAKYTPTGAALKYKVRFQNTGNDMAYRVVVVDTLSEHLDLSTLQVGSASHTHRFNISGKGKPVLTWTFDNIMLPDSTTNEPGSHGYIQFSIKPKSNLPEKTAVENFADIYFDFNSPIRTNQTVNRIFDMPAVVNEAVRLAPEQVIATPVISSFEPAAGKFGEVVTLTGKKFSVNPIQNNVYFNGLKATVLSASENELKVRVPTNATTGSLKIQTPDGLASTTEIFEVYQPPVLNSFSPSEGIVGTSVTLQGSNLNANLIQSIKLGSLNCEIISSNGNTLVVKVPAQAATAKFEIHTMGGNASSAAAFVVWHQPVINSLSKNIDIVGATINIYGDNFATPAARNKVMFGQVQTPVLQASGNQLTVKVPPAAQSGYVTVETPGGRTLNSTYFEVIPAPVFTSMRPAKGPIGTEVEISGEHFLALGSQDEITFNGIKAQVLQASHNTYKVTVPRGASSGKVKITGVGGVAYSTSDFVVEKLSPDNAIEVYPNPTRGAFTINFTHADFDIQEVQIFSTTGRLLHTTDIPKPRPDKLEMNAETLAPGVYVLKIKSDRGLVIKKITVL